MCHTMLSGSAIMDEIDQFFEKVMLINTQKGMLWVVKLKFEK